MKSSPLKVRSNRSRSYLTIITSLILIVIVFLISMDIGYIKLTPAEVFQALIGKGTDQQNLILFDFRLPRMIVSLLVGAGLAVSGAILQGISKNPLADPGILGINAGAGLMVVIFIAFFSVDHASSVFMLPFMAFIGSGIAAAVIYLLSFNKNEGLSPARMILVGVAVGAVISAIMIVLTLRLEPESYQFVASWLAGSIWASNWSFVIALLPWVIVLIPYSVVRAHVLDILTLGRKTAIGLGVNLEREQLFLLLAAVGLAGSSVAVSGGISFVGLIGPHLARRLVGAPHRLMLPVSALLGAVLLLMADTIGRAILQPSEIPTGIVVAVIGAPYFLYLLVKTSSR
ncbi:MAG: FecCD family ABC transporter permease [Tuberibacillus sp.]